MILTLAQNDLEETLLTSRSVAQKLNLSVKSPFWKREENYRNCVVYHQVMGVENQINILSVKFKC
jgi:hypothetical protein